jgi:hypothetical protein
VPTDSVLSKTRPASAQTFNQRIHASQKNLANVVDADSLPMDRLSVCDTVLGLSMGRLSASTTLARFFWEAWMRWLKVCADAGLVLDNTLSVGT